MDIVVTITGDELTELQNIVAQIQREQPTVQMTEQIYVQNYVMAYLTERVRNSYLQQLSALSNEQLRTVAQQVQVQ